MSQAYTFEFLTCTGEKTATKTYAKDHNNQILVKDFDAGIYFTFKKTLPIETPQTFFNFLKSASQKPNSFIIHFGQLKEGLSRATPHRRLSNVQKHGDKITLTHTDKAVHILDADTYYAPFPTNPRDPQSLIKARDHFLKELGLSDYTCVFQWSGTAFWDKKVGKEDPYKLSAKIGIFTDQPVCVESFRDWVEHNPLDARDRSGNILYKDKNTTQPKKILDVAVNSIHQPVFIANPVFANGIQDHVAERITLYEGKKPAIPTLDFGLEDSVERAIRLEEEEEKKRLEEEKKKNDPKTKKKKTPPPSINSPHQIEKRRRALFTKLEGMTDSNRNDICFNVGRELGYLLKDDVDRLADTLEEALEVVAARGGGDWSKHQQTFANAFHYGVHFHTPKDPTHRNPRPLPKKTNNKVLFTPSFLPALPKDFRGLLFLLASMGTGKTKRIIDLIYDLGFSQLTVVPTQSLSQNVTKRYNDAGVPTENYLDQQIDGITPDFYHSERGLTVCLDSLPKVRGHYPIVVLDEVHEILGNLLKPFKGTDFAHVYNALRHFLSNAEIVIASSANLLPEHEEILKSLCGEKPTQKITHISENRNEEHFFLSDEDPAIIAELLHKALIRGERPLAFFVSQRQLLLTKRILQKRMPKIKILSHHSEQTAEEKEAMAAPDKFWPRFDAIFITSSAASGLDFSRLNVIDAIYVDGNSLDSNVLEFDYTTIAQAVKRVRHTITNKFFYYLPEKKARWRKPHEIAREHLSQNKKTIQRLEKEYNFHRSEIEFVENWPQQYKAFCVLTSLKERHSCYQQQRLRLSLTRRGIPSYDISALEYTQGKYNELKEENPQAADYYKEKVLITPEQTEQTLKETKNLRKQIKQEFKEMVVVADDLTEEEAKALSFQSQSQEDKAAIEKFRLKEFYGEEFPVNLELIEQDENHLTRKRLRNREIAQKFSQVSEFFLQRDKQELTHRYQPALARNFYNNAEVQHDLLFLAVQLYPELNKYLVYPFEIEEHFDKTQKIQEFITKHKNHPDFLSWKQKEADYPIEKLIGELFLRHLGINRISHKETLKDENGNSIKDENGKRKFTRIYSLDLENENLLYRLGAARRERLEQEINTARFQLGYESMPSTIQTIGFDGETVTDNPQTDYDYDYDSEEFQKLFEEEKKVSQQKEITQTESEFIDRFYN